MLSVEQAVEFIDEKYGLIGGPHYSARFSHEDENGSYVIQVNGYNEMVIRKLV